MSNASIEVCKMRNTAILVTEKYVGSNGPFVHIIHIIIITSGDDIQPSRLLSG